MIDSFQLVMELILNDGVTVPKRQCSNAILLGIVAIGAGAVTGVQAHTTSAPRAAPDYYNAIGFAVGYGQTNDRDAPFWGFAVEYSRAVFDRWVIGAGLAWDEETERFEAKPSKSMQTISAMGNLSYNLSERFSLTLGLAKGFADDDNAAESMQFSSGDVGVGVALGIATPGLPQYVQDSIGLSLNYEYNLSQEETTISLDLVFGWSY